MKGKQNGVDIRVCQIRVCQNSKIYGDKRIMGPIQQARGQAMMLRNGKQLPIILRNRRKVASGLTTKGGKHPLLVLAAIFEDTLVPTNPWDELEFYAGVAAENPLSTWVREEPGGNSANEILNGANRFHTATDNITGSAPTEFAFYINAAQTPIYSQAYG